MLNPVLVMWLAASIEGRLWNPVSGGPVRKADVVIGTAQGVAVRRTLSDGNGHYSVSNLPAGRYCVAAGRAGFLPALATGVIVLRADEARRDVNLALEPPAVVTGRVLDPEGEPVEGVTVAAYLRKGTGLARAGTGRTDDQGEYRISGLVPGTYLLQTSALDAGPEGQVYAPVFYPDSAEPGRATPVKLAAGSEARDLDLRVEKLATGSIAGVVQGAGTPVVVTLSRIGSGSEPVAFAEAEATAQPSGLFAFPKLAPGTYAVTASTEQPFRWAAEQTAIVPGHSQEVALTLQPGRALPLLASGPVQAVLTHSNGWTREARRSESGTLVFSDLMPGTWQLMVKPLAPESYVSSIRWDGRELPSQTLALPKGSWPALQVEVARDGGTLEGRGASASLVNDLTGQVFEGSAGEAGRFQIRGIRPGKYRLSCTGELLELHGGELIHRDCAP